MMGTQSLSLLENIRIGRKKIIYLLNERHEYVHQTNMNDVGIDYVKISGNN